MSRIYKNIIETLEQTPRVWLITGVSGFIGSNLLENLLLLGQRVIGLDNFATGTHANLEDVKNRVNAEAWQRFDFLEGDIRNVDDCRRAVRGVDFILHHAALGSVPTSIENPILTNSVNVEGFLNMLVAAQEAEIRNFVFASSCAIYGDSHHRPQKEEQTGNSLSPYSVSKVTNELYAAVFNRVHGQQCTGLRYFNVYGPRQDPQGAYAAVIPKWIDCLMQGQGVTIYGDGETTRDFCYIKDVVQANILAAMDTQHKHCSFYNVASGTSTSLNALYACLAALLDVNQDEAGGAVRYEGFRAGDIRFSEACLDRIGQELGYRPAYGMQQGLGETLEWYFASAAHA